MVVTLAVMSVLGLNLNYCYQIPRSNLVIQASILSDHEPLEHPENPENPENQLISSVDRVNSCRITCFSCVRLTGLTKY